MAKYKTQRNAEQLIDVAKALSDMNRVRALYALEGRELCVCQIIALLELAPSTVSKHMSILRRAGLVSSRKEGRWVYYHLPQEDAPALVTEAVDWVMSHMQSTEQGSEDQDRMEEILNTDPEQLCKRQNAN